MGGNSFGEVFRITTFGESHGEGVGVVVDGCPSGIHLSAEDFERDMERRRPGREEMDTARNESDRVEILSGVFEGLSTGAPVTLFIRNRDVDSRPYEVLRRLFRPGHADYTYFKKYGHFDFRGGGRSSARETAARVAAGVMAGKVLEPTGLKVLAYTLELGGIHAEQFDPRAIENNPCYCPDPHAAERMASALKEAKEKGDSLGGIVEIRIQGCPPGLGEPVFDKLDADLAKAAMSVGAVKGVEIGAGFEVAGLRGSESNDPILPEGFETNRAGGILGGISNGDEIVVRAAVKPVPSIGKEQRTIDRAGQPARLRLTGRYDISAVPRAVPVLEAMVRIVLADHYLRASIAGESRQIQ
jgi:chorismate synthase